MNKEAKPSQPKSRRCAASEARAKREKLTASPKPGFAGHSQAEPPQAPIVEDSPGSVSPFPATEPVRDGEAAPDKASPGPAPDAGDTPVQGAGVSQGPGITLEQLISDLYTQIKTLSDNQVILNQKIEENIAQPTEPQKVDLGLDQVPEWLKKPLVEFMGDLGKAARGFAGGGDSGSDTRRALIDRVLKKDDERRLAQLETRADMILRVIDNPLASVSVTEPVEAPKK